jgi:Ca-activated chloride channel family protein
MSGGVATAVKDVFYRTKKKATVVVMLDTSGSMRGSKIVNAVEATAVFVRHLDRDDEVYVLTFNDEVAELQPSGRAGDVAESLSQTLSGLWAEGNTALYDAVCEAVASAKRLQ